MQKPILISISPNIEKDDVVLALKSMFRPISWYNFRYTEELENKFEADFGKGFKALAVNSGRGAMYLILQALGVGKGDEVIVQAFTCSAAVNPIIWAGARPVYVDVDTTFNLDPKKIEMRVTKKTKAIIVQHTFGIPADLKLIMKIAKKHKLKLIEDCAVSLGATYSRKPVGTFGDASFFSTGRDKIISSTFGGMILSKDKKLFGKIFKLREDLPYPSALWLMQQLRNPILTPLIKKTYFWGFGKITIGKIFLAVFQKLKFLGLAISEEEKNAWKAKDHPKKMPGILALLAINQYSKLTRFNKRRIEIADKYFKLLKAKDMVLPPNIKGSVWLRFPILVDQGKNELINFAKRKDILLGDWYKTVIYPVNSLNYFFYKYGECPVAEKYSKELVNLPTYPTMTDADVKRVVDVVNSFRS